MHKLGVTSGDDLLRGIDFRRPDPGFDVLNHPEQGTPILNINTLNFGEIKGAAAKSTLHRQFQASLKFTF